VPDRTFRAKWGHKGDNNSTRHTYRHRRTRVNRVRRRISIGRVLLTKGPSYGLGIWEWSVFTSQGCKQIWFRACAVVSRSIMDGPFGHVNSIPGRSCPLGSLVRPGFRVCDSARLGKAVHWASTRATRWMSSADNSNMYQYAPLSVFDGHCHYESHAFVNCGYETDCKACIE
jgi:hypothetical protein